MIRPVQLTDAPAIARLYNDYIVNTTISFETERVSAEEIATRIRKVTSFHTWLVYEGDSRVVGYAYSSAFRERRAYRGTVESTIYLEPSAIGRGIGRVLYQALLDAAAAQGYREALGVIALPNDPSIRLHERQGFVKVAHLSAIGSKFGRWIDVGIWQKHLTTAAPSAPNTLEFD